MDDLPRDVGEFIRVRLTSIEQLAILQLLEANRARAWTIAELSTELRSADGAVERRVRDLAAAGVVTPFSTAISWAVVSADLEPLVLRVLDAYRERPNRVIELIYSRPNALEAFADAFKLKKDKS